jgi:hypothetical protein
LRNNIYAVRKRILARSPGDEDAGDVYPAPGSA